MYLTIICAILAVIQPTLSLASTEDRVVASVSRDSGIQRTSALEVQVKQLEERQARKETIRHGVRTA